MPGQGRRRAQRQWRRRGEQDQVIATFPHAQAEAMLVAAADSLTVILALDMIRITATTERAIEMESFGGLAENRTRVHGFAVRCVTTPPPGHWKRAVS
jgi:hypothetical protein